MDTKLHSARTPVEAHQAVTPSVVEGRRRWVLREDARRERRAIILGLFLGGPMLIVGPGVGSTHPALAVVVAAALVGTALYAVVSVRRLPRLLSSGLIGGGVAGLIVIGAGSRLAMRIVSLTGGRREVTIGGTMFLLIAGAVFGAFVGVAISSMIRIWRVRGLLVGAALTLFPGGGLLLASDTRTELLHEGAGAWVNIPMFLALFPVFGILAVRAIRRVDERLPRPPLLDPMTVVRRFWITALHVLLGVFMVLLGLLMTPGADDGGGFEVAYAIVAILTGLGILGGVYLLGTGRMQPSRVRLTMGVAIAIASIGYFWAVAPVVLGGTAGWFGVYRDGLTGELAREKTVDGGRAIRSAGR